MNTSAAAEIAATRREAEFKNLANSIADLVTYPMMLAGEITNPVRMSLYRIAIERYQDQMPPDLIRRIVDATIHQELDERQHRAKLGAAIKKLPRFDRRRRFRR
jgi:hypothetical protein